MSLENHNNTFSDESKEYDLDNPNEWLEKCSTHVIKFLQCSFFADINIMIKNTFKSDKSVNLLNTDNNNLIDEHCKSFSEIMDFWTPLPFFFDDYLNLIEKKVENEIINIIELIKEINNNHTNEMSIININGYHNDQCVDVVMEELIKVIGNKYNYLLEYSNKYRNEYILYYMDNVLLTGSIILNHFFAICNKLNISYNSMKKTINAGIKEEYYINEEEKNIYDDHIGDINMDLNELLSEIPYQDDFFVNNPFIQYLTSTDNIYNIKKMIDNYLLLLNFIEKRVNVYMPNINNIKKKILKFESFWKNKLKTRIEKMTILNNNFDQHIFNNMNELKDKYNFIQKEINTTIGKINKVLYNERISTQTAIKSKEKLLLEKIEKYKLNMTYSIKNKTSSHMIKCIEKQIERVDDFIERIKTVENMYDKITKMLIFKNHYLFLINVWEKMYSNNKRYNMI